jgi:hypothetical protein
VFDSFCQNTKATIAARKAAAKELAGKRGDCEQIDSFQDFYIINSMTDEEKCNSKHEFGVLVSCRIPSFDE